MEIATTVSATAGLLRNLCATLTAVSRRRPLSSSGRMCRACRGFDD